MKKEKPKPTTCGKKTTSKRIFKTIKIIGKIALIIVISQTMGPYAWKIVLISLIAKKHFSHLYKKHAINQILSGKGEINHVGNY